MKESALFLMAGKRAEFGPLGWGHKPFDDLLRIRNRAQRLHVDTNVPVDGKCVKSQLWFA